MFEGVGWIIVMAHCRGYQNKNMLDDVIGIFVHISSNNRHTNVTVRREIKSTQGLNYAYTVLDTKCVSKLCKKSKKLRFLQKKF